MYRFAQLQDMRQSLFNSIGNGVDIVQQVCLLPEYSRANAYFHASPHQVFTCAKSALVYTAC